MAITSGAGPHVAWLNVDGGTFPIEHGSVEQQATRKSSTFSAAIPLSFPGAEATLANLGDNVATITVLTRGSFATLITGEIDTTSFDYIGRTIRCHGRDKAAKLHEKMTSEKWLNKTGSDIVQDLCGRIGLSCNANIGGLLAGKMVQQDYVRLSDNVTFAKIIHKLAEFDGARWWVDNNGVFNYVAAGSPAGTYTLNYVPPSPYIRADFTKLTITRNIPAGKTINVKVNSWNPSDKQAYKKEATVGGSGGPLEYNYDIPNLKQDHVDQHAKSRANELARNELKLSASVVGDPSCNVSMGLQLTGTGYWDQMYEMDCVHHEIGMSGHRTNITARSGKGGRSAS
jgi:hypothetical protein